MRIISRKHDYYDIGLGLGHEDSVVYVREPVDIELHKYSKPRKTMFDYVFVGFCGKIYVACVAHAFKPIDDIVGVCYTIEEVDRFVRENFSKRDAERYSGSNSRTRSSGYPSSWIGDPLYNYGLTDRNSICVSFKNMKDSAFSRYSNLFREYNCPIFVVDPPENKIHVNCLLRPWEFYKVFDPYSAFQEISMYVGGVLLAPVNPVPVVSDETMRDIKGFDKFSFRKDKSK